MTGLSFAGALLLGLAAAAAPSAEAKAKGGIKCRGSRCKDDEKEDKTEINNGEISIGNPKTTKKTIVNSVECEATVTVGTWARASSAYVNAVMEAIVVGCKGDVRAMTKTVEDEARAYARIAIDTHTQCQVKGSSGYGCATAEGSAMAHATAVYDAWLEAYAEAAKDPEVCDCVLDVYAASFANIEYWGDIFAAAMGSVKNGVCQTGEGKSSIDSSVECYANAVAALTAKATAGAWLDAEKKCGPKDFNLDCKLEYEGECEKEAMAKAKAFAKAVLEVDEETSGDCDFKYSKHISDGGKVVFGKDDQDGSIETSEEEDFKATVRCMSEALAGGTASAAYQFVDTVIDAYKSKCKSGVEEFNIVEEGVGRAFASAWLDVSATCKVNDQGKDAGTGCALVEAFAEVWASGVADAWVIADSKGMFDDCKCKVEASAEAEARASFTAELFAKVITTAGGDLWGANGENCVTDGSKTVETQLECTASAMAAFWNRAHVKARLEGECLLKDASVCKHAKGPEEKDCFEDNKLYVSSYASAAVETDVELQEGFCTGDNQGGYYTFDGKGKYVCTVGC